MQPYLGLLGGLAAGWVCFVSGHWLNILRLPKVDLGAMGRRYIDEPTVGWVFGLIHHLINSVLLGALYAALLGWTGLGEHLVANSSAVMFASGEALGRTVMAVFIGTVYGFFVWVVVPMSLIMPASDRGWFGSKLDDRKVVVSNLVVHLIFGAVLGLIVR